MSKKNRRPDRLPVRTAFNREQAQKLALAGHGSLTMRDEANFLALVSFRSGQLEDLHAQGLPIGDREMKGLMIEASGELAYRIAVRDHLLKAKPDEYFAYLLMAKQLLVNDWEREATAVDELLSAEECESCSHAIAAAWAYCPHCGTAIHR